MSILVLLAASLLLPHPAPPSCSGALALSYLQEDRPRRDSVFVEPTPCTLVVELRVGIDDRVITLHPGHSWPSELILEFRDFKMLEALSVWVSSPNRAPRALIQRPSSRHTLRYTLPTGDLPDDATLSVTWIDAFRF